MLLSTSMEPELCQGYGNWIGNGSLFERLHRQNRVGHELQSVDYCSVIGHGYRVMDGSLGDIEMVT